MTLIITVTVALLSGVALGWYLGRRSSRADLEALKVARDQLTDAFKSASADALAQNNRTFLDLAKENLERFQEQAKADLEKRQSTIGDLVKPVKSSLDKFESRMHELEKVRVEGQATLRQQMSALIGAQQTLQRETTKLSSALRSTTIRGRWGEIQLRRVVELAGMVSHCDFFEQQSAMGADGRRRPDMLVRLPAGRQIIVDAKAPLDAYIEASDTQDEEKRTELLKRHAQQIRSHVRSLSARGYTEHFEETPEFVVLFLPGETFFSAALAHDPTLIELGAEQGVIIATPTTLIALLRAVFHGWKQEAISENARHISELGKELYKRLSTVGQHWAKVGKNLGSAVQAYNDAVGSMERRVMPKAREFEKLGEKPTLDPLPQVEQAPRSITL